MISEPTFEAPAVELSEKGPWQQMANESTKAFATFSEFLELGPDASLQDVVAKTGKSLSAVRSLSSRFQWFARAAAWRQHFAAIKGHALQRATEKTVELWAMREQALRELEWENS